MDGYKIIYRTSNGVVESTWFGKPESSFNLNDMSNDEINNLVLLLFYQAHPGCHVISMVPCTVKEFQSK